MKIYIMRHGEAELMAAFDSERRLTAFGSQQSFAQGEKLQQSGICPQLVLVSPYVRAQQTFSQVNQAFEGRLGAVKETWKALTPDGSSALVRDYLSHLKEQRIDTLLIISHLPLVGEIAAELCQNRPRINFYTSTIAEIDWNGESGSLQQIYYPE